MFCEFVVIIMDWIRFGIDVFWLEYIINVFVFLLRYRYVLLFFCIVRLVSVYLFDIVFISDILIFFRFIILLIVLK